MTYRVNILVMVILISAPVFLLSRVSDNKPSQEYTAINRTLNYYFHGVEMYDVEALKKAYHPDANLSFIDQETGAMEQFNATQYFAMIAEAPHVVQERSLHVRSIDITGNAALVKTEIIYDRRGQRISDYLLKSIAVFFRTSTQYIRPQRGGCCFFWGVGKLIIIRILLLKKRIICTSKIFLRKVN